jgi:hypothetical protein
MEDLIFLARCLSSKNLLRQEIIGEKKNGEDSLLDRFYTNVSSGKYQNDEEASENLYGLPPTANKYQVLKSKLKSRCLTTLSLYQINEDPWTYSTFVQETKKELSIANLLFHFGNSDLAVSIVTRILPQAKKYTATSIELECSVLLRTQYYYEGNLRKHEAMCKKIAMLMQRQNDEIKAEELQERIMLPFATSRAELPQMTEDIDELDKEMRKIAARSHTYLVAINSFRFGICLAQLKRNYNRLIEVCAEAEKYFKRNPHLGNRPRIAEFMLAKAEAYLFLREYQKAREAVQFSLDRFQTGTANWMSAQQYNFIISLHLEDWKRAVEIFESVSTNPRFADAQEHTKELWRILEAYLLYLIPQNQDELRQNRYSKNVFRIYMFLNDVPIYSADKLGANISILILQALWLLEERSFDRLLKMQKTLENYINRYIKKEVEHERGGIFLRMLLALVRSDFRKELAQKKAARYLEALQPKPGVPSASSMEIYPYEQLWKLVLTKLQ